MIVSLFRCFSLSFSGISGTKNFFYYSTQSRALAQTQSSSIRQVQIIIIHIHIESDFFIIFDLLCSLREQELGFYGRFFIFFNDREGSSWFFSAVVIVVVVLHPVKTLLMQNEIIQFAIVKLIVGIVGEHFADKSICMYVYLCTISSRVCTLILSQRDVINALFNAYSHGNIATEQNNDKRFRQIRTEIW